MRQFRKLVIPRATRLIRFAKWSIDSVGPVITPDVCLAIRWLRQQRTIRPRRRPRTAARGGLGLRRGHRLTHLRASVCCSGKAHGGPPIRDPALATGGARNEAPDKLGVAVLAEPFRSNREPPPDPIDRVDPAASMPDRGLLDPPSAVVGSTVAELDDLERPK
jgi:hypothetical protein